MHGSRVGHAWSFEVSCCAEKAFDASQLLERKTENEASFSQEYSDALNKREKEYSKDKGKDFLECSRMLISRLGLKEYKNVDQAVNKAISFMKKWNSTETLVESYIQE